MKVQDLVKVRRAVISVYDKKNLGSLAESLVSMDKDIEIFSSGGTASELQKTALMNVKDVAEYTAFPEMPSGLVKTLHPKIHAGILSQPGNDEHIAYLRMHRIKAFDMVVVNLYPFSSVAADAKATVEDARKNIDIGGVAMIEAAAKNFVRVVVVVDPSDYASLLANMRKNKGSVDLKSRIQLAKKAFRHISLYLGNISGYFDRQSEDSIQRFYGVERYEWKERLQERLRKDN